MTFKLKRTKGQGVEFEITSRQRIPLDERQWLLPARAYRTAARQVIDGLIAENRALRNQNREVRVTVAQKTPWLQRLGTVLNRIGGEG